MARPCYVCAKASWQCNAAKRKKTEILTNFLSRFTSTELNCVPLSRAFKALTSFVAVHVIEIFAQDRVGTDQQLTNTQRFPTFISFTTTDITSTVRAVISLLEKFDWHTLTLLCDTLKDLPAVKGFYMITCQTFVAVLNRQKRSYTTNLHYYNSSNVTRSENISNIYGNILVRAGNESRGLNDDMTANSVS